MTQWRCHALVEKNYMRNRCAYFYIYRRTAYPRRGTSMAGHRFLHTCRRHKTILPLSSSFPNIISGLRLRQQGWLTLYILHITKRLDKKKKLLMPGWNMNWKKAEAYQNRKKHPEKNRKRKEKPGLTLRLILK